MQTLVIDEPKVECVGAHIDRAETLLLRRLLGRVTPDFLKSIGFSDAEISHMAVMHGNTSDDPPHPNYRPLSAHELRNLAEQKDRIR